MKKSRIIIITTAVIAVLLITTTVLLNLFYVYHEENDVSELEHILIRDNSVKGYMRDISKDSKHFYTEDEITAIEKAVRKLRFYPTDIVETNDLGRPSSTILFKYKDGRRRTIDTYENYSILAFSTGALGVDRDTIRYYRVNSKAVVRLVKKFLGK